MQIKFDLCRWCLNGVFQGLVGARAEKDRKKVQLVLRRRAFDHFFPNHFLQRKILYKQGRHMRLPIVIEAQGCDFSLLNGIKKALCKGQKAWKGLDEWQPFFDRGAHVFFGRALSAIFWKVLNGERLDFFAQFLFSFPFRKTPNIQRTHFCWFIW